MRVQFLTHTRLIQQRIYRELLYTMSGLQANVKKQNYMSLQAWPHNNVKITKSICIGRSRPTFNQFLDKEFDKNSSSV